MRPSAIPATSNVSISRWSKPDASNWGTCRTVSIIEEMVAGPRTEPRFVPAAYPSPTSTGSLTSASKRRAFVVLPATACCRTWSTKPSRAAWSPWYSERSDFYSRNGSR